MIAQAILFPPKDVVFKLKVNFFLKFSQTLQIVTGQSSPLCTKLRQC